ncbi:TPA: hypothetical protein ACKEVR_003896, partial [Acinetobacter baumannii]
MNAPVNVQQELMPVPASMREIDRKRYLWMISPALPVIGLGILAGYHGEFKHEVRQFQKP